MLDLKQQDLKLTFKVKQTVGTKLFADLWMENLMVVSTQTRSDTFLQSNSSRCQNQDIWFSPMRERWYTAGKNRPLVS